MKYLSFITVFIYSVNSDTIFGREIVVTEWQYWVPIGMMLIGFAEGLLTKK